MGPVSNVAEHVRPNVQVCPALLKEPFRRADIRRMRVPMRLPILCCLAALVPAASAASAAAAPAITEFPIPQLDTWPLGIAGLPNGSLIFAQASRNEFATSTTAGAMFEFPVLSGPTEDVAVAGGYAWLTEPGAARIARVNLSSGGVNEFQLPAKADPTDITAGPDGNVWFTEPGAPVGIGKITPLGQITQYPAQIGPADKPTGITAGPDGNVWFTEAGNPARIGKITPSGAVTLYSAGLTPTSAPTSIATGPDGNLWFTETANPGRIGRITPAGVITEFSSGLAPNSAPTSITAGPGGDLWFTETANPGAIGWITPQGVISQVATPTPNSAPADIAEAGSGNLWFTEDGAHGRLGEVAVASPSAVTDPAIAIGPTSATLTGSVNPAGFATTYQFQWGATTAYGQSAPSTAASAGSGSLPGPASQVLTGLAPSTTYHFRLVASNCGGCQSGTSVGPDMTFTTASAPSTPTQTASSTAVAAPVIGHTAVAKVLAGRILIQVRGSKTLTPLSAERTIPLGSLIDARHGRLDVTTAISRQGRMQTAAVWGGRFVIGQSGAHGMTTFRIPTAAPECPAHADVSGDALSSLAIAANARTTGTSLWAKDNHGRYSTRGHNSVATVRGTEWKTVESCRGTLTFVKKGVVSVRDLHTHRTVLVHAGHSFLARP
jgi:streptogramin lyase